MNIKRFEKRICGRPLSRCLQIIEGFHGWKAPGLVLGVFMVDLAQKALPKGVEADAVVETRHCLPDAVQLFTPCTVGNGWLKILDWDKFALTLFDRKTFTGSRVWLDPEKARAFPNLYNWYMRRVAKKDLPLDVLLEAIIAAGTAPLSRKAVLLHRFGGRIKKGDTRLCPACGEAYRADQGPVCIACAGGGYCHTTETANAAAGPLKS
jgi:formylmethanofuran dehydrogenase subunit E